MHFNADTISITDVNVNHIRYLSTARATMTLNFAPSPVTTDSSRCNIHSLTGTDALVIISGHHWLPRASFHTSGICSLQSVSIQPTELQHYSTPQRASSSAAKLIHPKTQLLVRQFNYNLETVYVRHKGSIQYCWFYNSNRRMLTINVTSLWRFLPSPVEN